MKEYNFSITDEINGYARFINCIISKYDDKIIRKILENSWRDFVNIQRKEKDILPYWGFVENLCWNENNTPWIGMS